MKSFASMQGLKYAAVLAAALTLGACAKNPTDMAAVDGRGGAGVGVGAGGAGSASPGSQQDFVVNVGDRVFFDSDSTELSATAQATLDKQATWLNQYGNYAFTVEGHADERGTREYNFALGARRAEVHQELPRLARRRRLAHQDHLLRQGTSGRGLRRHLLLVAEPPRRHRPQGRPELNRSARPAGTLPKNRSGVPRRRSFYMTVAQTTQAATF